MVQGQVPVNSGPAAHSLSLVALRDVQVEAVSRNQIDAQGMRLAAHPAAREALWDIGRPVPGE